MNQNSRLYNNLAINITFRGASSPIIMHNGQFHTHPPVALAFNMDNVWAVSTSPDNRMVFKRVLVSVR